MKNIYLLTTCSSVFFLSNCCDINEASERLGKILDSGDAEAAIHAMEDPCIAKIPRIESTKAMLLLKLSMDQPDKRKKKILRDRGVALLKQEADNGDPSARSVLDDYEKFGDSYLLTFPWGSLLGPGKSQNSPRGW